MNERTLEQIRPQLDPAILVAAWDEGEKLTPEKALDLALEKLEAARLQ
jgi:hypothetical protein